MGRLPSVSIWPKAEIGQGLTVFILQDRPQRPVRNSLDHLVGAGEHRRGEVEPERLCGFEVDDQAALNRLNLMVQGLLADCRMH
jgi:hypothetical protein